MERFAFVDWKSFSRALGLAVASLAVLGGPAHAQVVANSLAELRSYGLSQDNATIVLSATGGDPHPVTGIVTPGHYWINGDHIANPTGSEPIFMQLGGTGNTYNLSGATINLDTRKLDGFGRALGHDSGVNVVQITGSNNTIQGLTLIGQDIALDTDPNAQRYADWATQYVELSGDNNTVDGAYVSTRGSRTDAYGLSDAFGKGASQGISPYILHRKASAFRVGEATNAVVNDMHLEVNSFGHGFFVQSSTNTTLTNSTVTGELFPSSNVTEYDLYQQYGHTWWGEPIPDDIMLSGAEGGVRVYGGASGLTVDNVVVTNMRTGFATVHDGGDVVLNNAYAYGTTSGFDVGDNTTITNSGGNIINGPLLVFYGSGNNTTIDLELTGGTPIGTDWSAAYFNGNADITLTSDLQAGDLPEASYIRLGQSYFENWRNFDYNTAGPEDGGPTAFNNQTFVNDTYQMLVFGVNAEGNVGRSLGAVISNGKENHYDGVTLVQSGSRLLLTHDKGLGNSGTQIGAAFDGNGNVIYTGTATAQTMDDNGTIVEAGATLELGPGVQISDEKLTITGDGVDGQGALFSDSSDNRFGSSSSNNQSIIVLAGNASIGVEDAGDQLIVGAVQGTGDLTKRGLGKLALEKANTFDGDLIVLAGTVTVRPGGVNHGLTVAAGATISGLHNNAYNTADLVQLDGELDLNGRTGNDDLTQRIGQLSGTGTLNMSNPHGGSSTTLELVGAAGHAQYGGAVVGRMSLEKTGGGAQTFNGNLTHTGTTHITDGGLYINGSHTGGGDYTVDGGTLGGVGTIGSAVQLDDAILSPGRFGGADPIGELTLDQLVIADAATLRFELAGTTPGSGHDAITINDDLAFNGTLQVLLSGGYNPSEGDRFELFDFDSATGTFDAFLLPTLTNNMRWDTSQLLVDGSIRAGFFDDFTPGDFNGDGQVNQSDLDLVLANFGNAVLPSAWLAASQLQGGRVDQDEFNAVLRNWGASASPNLTVPEPGSLALLAMALPLLRRRRGL